MTETARLRLPEIAASQAQKHVTHNEALICLDTLVQASVIDKDLTAPPVSPAEGDCYIVAGSGGAATGDWTSWEKRIARFQDGQWTSFLPGAGSGTGWTCWVQDEKTLYTFDGTSWMNALRGKIGGGISVQYVFSTTTADSDPGNGTLRLNQAAQNTATVIRADLLDVNGTDWTAALASLADSTSTVKGHIRLFSVADPSKWLLFTVSAVASPSGYKNIAVALVASSSASPFSNGDAVVLSFSRTGDAGLNGTSGGSNSVCDGRLTLLSGTAVPTSDQTAKTSVYFALYKGNRIALYNGASWDIITFAEPALSLSGLAANTNYDIFGYNNAGALALEAAAWSNATARATTLAAQDGVLVKSGAPTRRYLGTIRITGTTGQCEDSAAKRFVWNMYNRAVRALTAFDTAANWTYSTAAFRQVNANSANQVALVRGLDEDAIFLLANFLAANSTATVRWVQGGIGLDASTSLAASCKSFICACSSTILGSGVSLFNDLPGLGYHFLPWLEYGGGADTQTWNGTFQHGVFGWGVM